MAKVQRIESDSAFSSANVLSGTILTYKTYQNGRVVHKAKLSNGSVVQITQEVDLSTYYTSSQVDQLIAQLSDSLSVIKGRFSEYYTSTVIDGILSSYYTSSAVNEILQSYISDSTFTSLDSRVTSIQHRNITGTYPITAQSNSTGYSIELNIDPNIFSVQNSSLTAQITLKKLATAQSGYAATYQLQGANGSAIGDKINVIQDVLLHDGALITATSQDQSVDPSVIVGDPYVKLQLYVQRSDSAGAYDTIYIPVKELVDTYTAGNGLTLVQGQFSIQADSNSDTSKYLSIGTSTLGLRGIGSAITSVRSQLLQVIEDLSNSVDLSNYYTKSEIDTTLSNSYYTRDQIDLLLQNFSDSSTGFNYKQVTQNTTAVDKDFLICRNALTVTLPPAAQGQLIGIATGSTGDNVSVVPATGDKIEVSISDSTSQGILLQGSHSVLILYGISNGWTIAEAAIKPVSIGTIQAMFQGYYTKEQINEIVSGLASDSLITSLQSRINGIDQKLQDYYNIEQVNQLIRGISDSLSIIAGRFDNYYTKGQVNAFLSDISNSFSNIKNKFSTYYTSSYIDTLVGDISDSTIAGAIKKKSQLPTGGSAGQFLQKTAVGTQWADLNMPKAVYVTFNQVDQQGYASFTGYGLPIGILAPSGNYYPVQKRSVQINTTTEITKIQVAPYVVYQNQSSFQGTWTACFPSPETGTVTVVVSPTQPAYPSDGTIWIQG